MAERGRAVLDVGPNIHYVLIQMLTGMWVILKENKLLTENDCCITSSRLWTLL